MTKTGGVLRYTINFLGVGDGFSRDPFADADDFGNVFAQGVIPADAILTAVGVVRQQTGLTDAFVPNVSVGAATVIGGYKTAQPIGISIAGVQAPGQNPSVLELIVQSFQAGAAHGMGL